MAKKESEISVESKLQTLYQLQTTLSAIDEKRALRGELPLEVQDLEDEIAGLKTRVEHIEGDINDFQQAVAQKQGEIKEAEESVERYKKQLDEVRNNREYAPVCRLTITRKSLFSNKTVSRNACSPCCASFTVRYNCWN